MGVNSVDEDRMETGLDSSHLIPETKKSPAKLNPFVGMRGFEPPISRPPDEHFNRTKLHPELIKNGAKFNSIYRT